MNRTALVQLLYGRGARFSNKEVADVGRLISDKMGPHRTIDGKQRSWRLPYNEFAQDKSTWPDKNHMKLIQ